MSTTNTDMNNVYVCVECDRLFHTKYHLLRHSLVHRNCMYCGKSCLNHKCKQTTIPTLTRQEALLPYLNSYHYKMSKMQVN